MFQSEVDLPGASVGCFQSLWRAYTHFGSTNSEAQKDINARWEKTNIWSPELKNKSTAKEELWCLEWHSWDGKPWMVKNDKAIGSPFWSSFLRDMKGTCHSVVLTDTKRGWLIQGMARDSGVHVCLWERAVSPDYLQEFASNLKWTFSCLLHVWTDTCEKFLIKLDLWVDSGFILSDSRSIRCWSPDLLHSVQTLHPHTWMDI